MKRFFNIVTILLLVLLVSCKDVNRLEEKDYVTIGIKTNLSGLDRKAFVSESDYSQLRYELFVDNESRFAVDSFNELAAKTFMVTVGEHEFVLQGSNKSGTVVLEGKITEDITEDTTTLAFNLKGCTKDATKRGSLDYYFGLMSSYYYKDGYETNFSYRYNNLTLKLQSLTDKTKPPITKPITDEDIITPNENEYKNLAITYDSEKTYGMTYYKVTITNLPPDDYYISVIGNGEKKDENGRNPVQVFTDSTDNDFIFISDTINVAPQVVNTNYSDDNDLYVEYFIDKDCMGDYNQNSKLRVNYVHSPAVFFSEAANNKTIYFDYKEEFLFPPNYATEYYQFFGWYTDPEFKHVVPTSSSLDFTSPKTINLYPKFIEKTGPRYLWDGKYNYFTNNYTADDVWCTYTNYFSDDGSTYPFIGSLQADGTFNFYAYLVEKYGIYEVQPEATEDDIEEEEPCYNIGFSNSGDNSTFCVDDLCEGKQEDIIYFRVDNTPPYSLVAHYHYNSVDYKNDNITITGGSKIVATDFNHLLFIHDFDLSYQDIIRIIKYEIVEEEGVQNIELSELNPYTFSDAELNCGVEEELYNITDMIYTNDALYVLFRAVKKYPYSDSYSFGAIRRYTVNNENKLIWDTTFNPRTIDLTEKGVPYAHSEYESTHYVYTPKSSNAEYFFGPAKFIAVKPKKLVIADDGFGVWRDENDNFYARNENRIVEIDLENQTFTSQETNCQFDFDVISGTDFNESLSSIFEVYSISGFTTYYYTGDF